MRLDAQRLRVCVQLLMCVRATSQQTVPLP